METEFDPDKDEITRAKHGISLAVAADMDLTAAVIELDERFPYGEVRFQAIGLIAGRLHLLAFHARRHGAGNLHEEGQMASRKKPPHISQKDWDEAEIPECTEENFARAKPFKEAFPEQYKAWKTLGRPPVESPKVHIGFRLAADVVNGVRATGPGYNARVEKVPREALEKGQF